MDSNPQETDRPAKRRKRVHFQRDSILEDVRIMGYRETYQQQEQQQYHRSQQQAIYLDELPPLFRCKTYEEIHGIVSTGKGAIGDIFRGYNALHWYCNAKSTSPGIIQTLLNFGIDIDALDQRKHTRGTVIRHTALGYACRNANVKGIHVLLQNGADPCGLARSGLPTQDAHGDPIVYPSPLQELLCQPTHGPRPGKCPWTYHLTEKDEENDGYLDEDDPDRLPKFRALSGLSGGSPEARSPCRHCAADYHTWEPRPATREERAAARARRRSCYYGQIVRLGNRLKACVQLLLNYNCSDPPPALPEYDDPHLWPGIDYLLETFWRFFYPLAICATGEGPSEDVFETVFMPFGEICDMLLEIAGYEKYEGKRLAGKTRGQTRLISLIAGHPEFESFGQGEYVDADGQLSRF